MSHIIKPPTEFGRANSVSTFLDRIKDWGTTHKISPDGYHSRVWYRGLSDRSFELKSGVYRSHFTSRSESHTEFYGDLEDRRLRLEREILTEFRTAGATFFDPNHVELVYFTAQHYGMPTRLLDWTMNPLTALFFAVSDNHPTDGEVIVMEPTALLPPYEASKHRKDFPRAVLTMRHPYAVDAIGQSFWHDPTFSPLTPLIIPIRPDNQIGRIGQQGSCFTLHMHRSTPTENPTLARITIQAGHKSTLREQLRRLNVNSFSIYNDLDSLSEDIKQSWGLLG